MIPQLILCSSPRNSLTTQSSIHFTEQFMKEKMKAVQQQVFIRGHPPNY